MYKRAFVSETLVKEVDRVGTGCKIQRGKVNEDECEEEDVPVLGTVKVCFLRHHLDEDCSPNGQTSPLWTSIPI